ncbi:uncharacterized protein LOC143289589 [Babylonia areolata]|uniref:uncharacterized protein LOC143289589 n=1 Tax=Babylonia areolata TaxID=304850 RepID=UPI003FCFC565
MSVFSSGLSRLRNSFRRKSGRLPETREKNGTTGKGYSRSARTVRSRSLSQTSFPEVDQEGVFWQEAGRLAGSPPEGCRAGDASVTGPDAAPSSHRVNSAVLPRRSTNDLMISSSSSESVHAAVHSAGRRSSTQRPPPHVEDIGHGNGEEEEEEGEVAQPLGDSNVHIPCAGDSDGRCAPEQPRPVRVTSSVPNTCPSLESSSSSLLAATTTSRSRHGDMEISASTLRATSYNNSSSSSNSKSPSPLHAKTPTSPDTDTDRCADSHTTDHTFNVPRNHGNKAAVALSPRPHAGGAVETSTSRDDVRDEDSDCSSTNPNPAGVSDGSYDNLPFTDAVERIIDNPDHDLSLAGSRDRENGPKTEDSIHQGVRTRVARDSKSPSPTLRTKTTTPHPNNRTSFGTNLQEVLGKAEQAKKSGELSGNDEDSSLSESTGCEIPPSLKESPSMLALHKDPVEDLTCRVCNELFRDPRILPCLHTFCSACITNLQTYPINLVDERTNSSKDPESRDALSPSPVGQDSTTSSSSAFSQKSGEGSRRSSEFYSVGEDQTGKAESSRVVLCPTCLKETQVSGTLEELPRNYVMERRVAGYESTHRGVVVNPECDSCGERGSITARCVECTENLCSLCELSHRRQKKTKRHQILNVTAAATAAATEGCRPSAFSSANEEPSSGASTNQKRGKARGGASRAARCRQVLCGHHPEEELKLYCLSCDVPVCRDCVVMGHRDHDCQFLSKELFKGQMGQIQHLIRSVVPRITSVDQQLRRVADTQEAIQARAQDVTREIHAYMDRFLSAIQQHRQQLLQQVGMVVEEKQHALHVTERHLRQVRADVEHTCRFVSDMIENASDVEILSVKRVVTERLTGLQEISATQHQPVSSFMRFSPSEAGEIINKFQMFGRVLSRRASAAASTIFSEGLSTARVGHDSAVVLRVNSEDGTQYNGKDVQIKAWLIFQSQSIRSLPVSVTLQKNGTYSLKFSPVQPGSHFLHVAVDSQPVKESPFKFKVKGQWREHKGVWHCCTVCSTGGRLDVPCACRGVMPGGQTQGCSHGEPGHPGGHHWSCCGKMTRTSECGGMPLPCTSPVRQVTL